MNDLPTNRPSDPEPVAFIEFAGGPMRPVYEDEKGQYVIDEFGFRVAGLWFIPKDESDTPTIVTR